MKEVEEDGSNNIQYTFITFSPSCRHSCLALEFLRLVLTVCIEDAHLDDLKREKKIKELKKN